MSSRCLELGLETPPQHQRRCIVHQPCRVESDWSPWLTIQQGCRAQDDQVRLRQFGYFCFVFSNRGFIVLKAQRTITGTGLQNIELTVTKKIIVRKFTRNSNKIFVLEYSTDVTVITSSNITSGCRVKWHKRKKSFTSFIFR